MTDDRLRAADADFRECESGAVTVDWVVLTAVVVVMFIFTAGPIFFKAEELLSGTANEISTWSAPLFSN